MSAAGPRAPRGGPSARPRPPRGARRASPQAREAVTPDARALVMAARQVRRRAHAPYSRFHVGAAILDDRGRIHVGCNVENASYGLTICAERNAIAAAVAAGARAVRAVAVVTDADPLGSPCGACRQVLAEFAGDDAVVVLAPPQGPHRETTTVGALLPRAFRLRSSR